MAHYLKGRDGTFIGEFAEVESGKRNQRQEMLKAIALCRSAGATLLIAKPDRLARDAAFLLNLGDSGVDFIATDMPHADKFTVGIMALAAEQERSLISERTRLGLAAAKGPGALSSGTRSNDLGIAGTQRGWHNLALLDSRGFGSEGEGMDWKRSRRRTLVIDE